MRAPLLASPRPAGARSALGQRDETDVFDAGLPELVHRRHDRAVLDFFIGPDDDDFLTTCLALEQLRHFRAELGFLNGRRQLPGRDILSLLHYE